jgi:2-keto-4-pentenoate hydratase/2-oxohepta-3-ene-1,7-dioic acid hydratase in catechol pathway
MDIYCIGRNYVDHAKELGNDVPTSPVIFLKSYSSLRGLNAAPMGFDSADYDYEAEIVLKITKSVKMGQKPGLSAAGEVALGLDLTRRDIQKELKEKGLPWTLAKSFKGSAIVGDFITTPMSPAKNLDFTLETGGNLRQTGKPSLMIFSFDFLVDHLASFNDLNKGDLIFTGTPKGVGKIKKGETFRLTFTSLNKSYDGVI